MKLLGMLAMALSSLAHHKLRSSLTMLGIVFGVGAVIAMLAIGEGARVEALRYIQGMGLTNVLLQTQKPSVNQAKDKESWVNIYGLTFADRQHIERVVPEVVATAATRELPLKIWKGAERIEGKIVATEPRYAHAARLEVDRGRFISAVDMSSGQAVCVVGADLARDLFGFRDPLNKAVQLNDEWFRVVGVLKQKRTSATSAGMATADFNRAVYLPETAATASFGLMQWVRDAGSNERTLVEISNLVVTMSEGADVRHAAALMERMLEKRHDVVDYSVLVPLELLEQQQRTQRIFSIVMGSIASISLLIGGIGIMNIMLATVMERTREIGIRRAVGASRRDIILQFLVETICLSVCGGVIGLMVGYGGAYLVERYAEMTTVVTAWSVMLAIGISGLVGVVFGLYPATKAAHMKIIDALRTA